MTQTPIEPGDVFQAQSGSLFVILGTEAGITYKWVRPDRQVEPYGEACYTGTGNRDDFNAHIGGYNSGLTYLGHRDHVAALDGLSL